MFDSSKTPDRFAAWSTFALIVSGNTAKGRADAPNAPLVAISCSLAAPAEPRSYESIVATCGTSPLSSSPPPFSSPGAAAKIATAFAPDACEHPTNPAARLPSMVIVCDRGAGSWLLVLLTSSEVLDTDTAKNTHWIALLSSSLLSLSYSSAAFSGATTVRCMIFPSLARRDTPDVPTASAFEFRLVMTANVKASATGYRMDPTCLCTVPTCSSTALSPFKSSWRSPSTPIGASAASTSASGPSRASCVHPCGVPDVCVARDASFVFALPSILLTLSRFASASVFFFFASLKCASCSATISSSFLLSFAAATLSSFALLTMADVSLSFRSASAIFDTACSFSATADLAILSSLPCDAFCCLTDSLSARIAGVPPAVDALFVSNSTSFFCKVESDARARSLSTRSSLAAAARLESCTCSSLILSLRVMQSSTGAIFLKVGKNRFLRP